MPIYEYECGSCGRRFDQLQRITEDPLASDPHCGGPVRRVIQPVGIIFKGSGFYVNDSRKSSSASSASSDSSKSDGTSDKSETKSDKSETKSETKSESSSNSSSSDAKPAAAAAR